MYSHTRPAQGDPSVLGRQRGTGRNPAHQPRPSLYREAREVTQGPARAPCFTRFYTPAQDLTKHPGRSPRARLRASLGHPRPPSQQLKAEPPPRCQGRRQGAKEMSPVPESHSQQTREHARPLPSLPPWAHGGCSAQRWGFPTTEPLGCAASPWRICSLSVSPPFLPLPRTCLCMRIKTESFQQRPSGQPGQRAHCQPGEGTPPGVLLSTCGQATWTHTHTHSAYAHRTQTSRPSQAGYRGCPCLLPAGGHAPCDRAGAGESQQPAASVALAPRAILPALTGAVAPTCPPRPILQVPGYHSLPSPQL